MTRSTAATQSDAGPLEVLADRAPMNAQLGTDLAQVRPSAYKSAKHLTSTGSP
jgi:hypothetical protein